MIYALLRYSQHLSKMWWGLINNEYVSGREIRVDLDQYGFLGRIPREVYR
jgi:hypothetical protein